MSGGFLPYHLRQGKAIDRQLFLEMLTMVGRRFPVTDYTYVGMGGPFLEDFKAVHGLLGVQRMISLELDEEVRKRQQYNRPLRCVECRLESTEDFVDHFDIEGPCIVWFDYAIARELPNQVAEFERLVAKLAHGDIVKITVNANAETLGQPQDLRGERLRERRLHKLTSLLGNYVPRSVGADAMRGVQYADALLQILRKASESAMEGSHDILLPLGAFTYSDSHRMLTLTALRITIEDKEDFLRETGFDRWSLWNSEWEQPCDINVPLLSVRERLLVDRLLPADDAEALQTEIGFQLHDDPEHSLRLIQNYIRYYRHYPQFSRVLV